MIVGRTRQETSMVDPHDQQDERQLIEPLFILFCPAAASAAGARISYR